jgi:phloretin hydrolase
MKTKPKLTEKQKNLSYAKYFYVPMAPIPDEKLAILKSGPIDPSKAMRIENRTELQNPVHTACETGFCIMEDGSGYVANLTFWPGVTVEMVNWWYLWHSLEDARYMIWDPEDHFYARNLDRAMALDQSLPIYERVCRSKHEVLEDIGGGASPITIEFKKPSEVGLNESKIGIDKGVTMLAGNLVGIATGVHIFREVDGGVELRSRFWIGHNIVDGKPVRTIPHVPIEIAMGLYNHAIKEYTNLGVLLPKVYAEEKNNW